MNRKSNSLIPKRRNRKSFCNWKFLCDMGFLMKKYDLIVIGTGTGTSVADAAINDSPKLKVAVIDKDEPGGICLTRGCIPSKLLIYPADVVRLIQRSREFGIDIEVRKIDFPRIMEHMRATIKRDIDNIRSGLSNSKNIDYYPTQAEFTAPYTLRVGDQLITSKVILLCTGSRPAIPPVESIDKTGYLTEEEVLSNENLDMEKINKYDFIIFPCTHRSSSEEKTLSIHVPGNWRDNRLGGEKGKVCPTSALFQKSMFEKLNEKVT